MAKKTIFAHVSRIRYEDDLGRMFEIAMPQTHAPVLEMDVEPLADLDQDVIQTLTQFATVDGDE